jgi:hypothetical protein
MTIRLEVPEHDGPDLVFELVELTANELDNVLEWGDRPERMDSAFERVLDAAKTQGKQYLVFIISPDGET